MWTEIGVDCVQVFTVSEAIVPNNQSHPIHMYIGYWTIHSALNDKSLIMTVFD